MRQSLTLCDGLRFSLQGPAWFKIVGHLGIFTGLYLRDLFRGLVGEHIWAQSEDQIYDQLEQPDPSLDLLCGQERR